MDACRDDPALAPVDADFVHLFSSWFNRGFLILRPIDWDTPASVLEKLIRYEAVHAIHGWDDLKNRLGPPDRRCYGFFHPRLPDDPLIFVEVAFTREIPGRIAPILDTGREPIAPEEATTAVFYSISNTQRGLAGVSFGNFLIKQVVEDLRREFPGLTTFVTLSPVPRFARWLDAERASEESAFLGPEARAALAALDTPGWHQNAELVESVRAPLLSAAAAYFLRARDGRGRVADAIARFHLGNGARLERLDMLGDTSPNGLEGSLRADGQLSLRSAHHRAEPRGLCRARRGHRVRRSAPPAARRPGRSAAPRQAARLAAPRRGQADRCRAPARAAMNLYARLMDGRDPAATAVETGEGHRWSYGDIGAASARMANLLVRRGVKPGDRVAVQVEKSVENLVLYLATVRAGAVYLPLNTAYTLAELGYFLGDAEPSLVVCDPAGRDGIAALVADMAPPSRRWQPTGRGASPKLPQARRRSSPRSRAQTTTSPPSSTPPAPPAAPRVRCSPTPTSSPMPRRWWRHGASPPRTCSSTLCRSTIRMACSWR